MNGLDTNILVRYLIQDDEAQAKTANLYIKKHCTDDSPAFINRIVLCELVWVLESAYKYEKKQIFMVLEKILQTSQFVVEDSGSAWHALADYKKTNVDFSDSLIGAVNKLAGCKKTATFDKQAGKLPDFEFIG